MTHTPKLMPKVGIDGWKAIDRGENVVPLYAPINQDFGPPPDDETEWVDEEADVQERENNQTRGGQ